MMRYLPPAVIVSVVLLSPLPASACSCMGGVPLCQSFWQADAVFAGEVLSFQPVNPKQVLSWRVARVRVDHVWRGSVEGSVDIATGSGHADCGYNFRKGEQYLIYAHRRTDGSLGTSVCSPTKPLDRAASDMAYIRDTRQPSSGGRVYGTAHFETKGADLKPAKGVVVTLTGESPPRTTVTNERGLFEFTGLPAGEYHVRMEGATAPPWQAAIRDPHACVNVNVWAPGPAKRD